MIVRVWKGKVNEEEQAMFESTVRNHDIPKLYSQPGCVQTLFGRQKGSSDGYVILTLWQDLDSLRNFTGPEWRKPVPGKTEAKTLMEEPEVEHYLMTPLQD
jgi:heme-degrading monooxygenase HmoA